MLDRRTFLRGAAVGTAALGTASLLAGCDTVTRSTDVAAINRRVPLPTYVRWKGPQTDLPSFGPGTPDAFKRYPSPVPSGLPSRPPGDGSIVRGFAATTNPIPPTKDRNRYLRELDRRLGVDLRMTISPSADFPNKFQTALAGDQLGDAFNIYPTPPYLPQLLEATAQDLTEHLSGDAVKDYPFLANLPTESWEGCVFSGAIYAVPIVRGMLGTAILLTRDDLFAKRGVPTEFADFDELLDIAKALTDAKSNRWAFTGVPQRTLGAMLGLPNTWDATGGRLRSESELEGHKDLLEAGRRLIAAGVVHPDSVSAYNGKVWFGQGSGAIIEDTYTSILGFLLQQGNENGFRIGMPIIPGPGGSPAKTWRFSPNNSIAAIRKASPQRTRMMLEVLNWMAAPFGTEEYTFRKYGIEGHDFDLRNGEPALTDAGNSETALGSYSIQYLSDAPIPIYYPGHPEGVDTVYNNVKVLGPLAILDPTYGLYSPTASTKGSVLSTLLSNASNDVLLGRKPVSSWDETMQRWRARGGDAARSEYERALEERGA